MDRDFQVLVPNAMKVKWSYEKILAALDGYRKDGVKDIEDENHLVNSKDYTSCKFSLETIGYMGGFIFCIVGSAHPNKTITTISSKKRYIKQL